MLSAPDRAQTEDQLRKSVEKYAHRASNLADWLEGNIPEGLTVFFVHGDHLCKFHKLKLPTSKITHWEY